MNSDYKSLNFIEQIIEDDLKENYNIDNLRFRFPPEPNGYLHIGHLKAIAISFGLGKQYNAPVNLRFDDTNPTKEDQEYVDAIKRDVKWLGYQWAEECYTSDYFEQLYVWALELIKKGKAYIDSQTSEQMASQKGTPTSIGTHSPFRDRSIEENLQLFDEMKRGLHPEGSHVLRAKIDMTHPNMLMRDPLMYRILKKHHQRTGDSWCIYPMYDWAHGESDYIEKISHSLCSLEFKPHRELYEWFLEQIDTSWRLPKQREFARLNLNYTIMSKRKLLELVANNIVSGWDDPRMPTISGLRRRGYTPKALHHFVETIGVAKRENTIEMSVLEYCIREDLNKIATRTMAVLNPVKLVITNYPEDTTEMVTLENNPEVPDSSTHEVPFSKELYIEKEDFKEEASSKFFRLTIGKEVRLKGAYIIKATGVEKDADGNIIKILAEYDAQSKSGSGSEASLRKVKGTLHWVSCKQAIPAKVHIYDRLFNDPTPDAHPDKSFMDFVNPDSLRTVAAYVEPFLQDAAPNTHYQFTRLGYFTPDSSSTRENLVFNKTVGLKDSWAKKKVKDSSSNDSISKPKAPSSAPPKKVISEVLKLGKKYTNLPEEKQAISRAKIIDLAAEVTFDELEKLFGTAKKKIGTRIAIVLCLGEYLKENPMIDPIYFFLVLAAEDEHPILNKEAQEVMKFYS